MKEINKRSGAALWFIIGIVGCHPGIVIKTYIIGAILRGFCRNYAC